MDAFLSERAARLTPYVAGEQPKDKTYIKLNTNENPYPPTPKIKDAINEFSTDLNLYPDANSSALCKAIAQTRGLTEDYIFAGNGSDEILSLVFYAFFDNNAPVLFPDITYSFYPVYANFYDIAYEEIPLNQNFEIDIADYLKNASGVIFPNPNAPTSIFLAPDEIRKLLDFHRDKVIVVDEAYIAFGGESMAGFVRDYPNLLVIRTFSKSHSLAGLRVGYAIGQPRLIAALRRVKDSFNSYPVDKIAATIAQAAILDEEYYTGINAKIIQTRQEFLRKIETIGFSACDSKANFVFITHAFIHAERLYYALKENGVLVRHFNKPLIENYLRVSIGTDGDMNRVFDILTQLIQKGGEL